MKSQFAMSKPGRGGRRTLPYAFTEQGVAMLSSVLNVEPDWLLIYKLESDSVLFERTGTHSDLFG